MHVLHIPSSLRTEIGAWCVKGYPLKTCGLLLGSDTETTCIVDEVVNVPIAAIAGGHDRYELAADDFVAADARARSLGLEIVGVWHSHPNQPALPSETDRARGWPGWS